MSTPLTSFLIFLLEDTNRLKDFNESPAKANDVMTAGGLPTNSPLRAALLNHDAKALRDVLLQEGYQQWPFTIASGPTAAGVDALSVLRIGTGELGPAGGGPPQFLKLLTEPPPTAGAPGGRSIASAQTPGKKGKKKDKKKNRKKDKNKAGK